MEKGQAPTAANRARVLGRSRQAVWQFDKRHSDFGAWQDGILSGVSSTKWGLLKNRMADLGIQGSPTHAEIFCRMESGHYGRAAGLESPLGGTTVVFNSLIPRPELPGGLPAMAATSPSSVAGATATLAASSLIPRPPVKPAIPTVRVR